MRALDAGILVVYVLGLSVGQLLFKLSADRAKLGSGEAPFLEMLLRAPLFYVSIALYGLLTLVWVWILSKVPLSRAYPFVAFSFVTTPLLASIFLKEVVNPWYFASLGLILSGLAVLIWKGGA